jgi:hypothetical protein
VIVPDAVVNVEQSDQASLRVLLDHARTIRLTGQGTLRLNQPLIIEKDLVLDGTGHRVTLSGGGQSRLFELRSNARLTLLNLTLAEGMTCDRGGAVLNEGGELFLSHCRFISNRVVGIAGQDGLIHTRIVDAGYEARGVAVDGGYAYVAAGTNGMLVFDGSVPAMPREIGRYRTAPANKLQVTNRHAYVATDSGLWIPDVSDPHRPLLSGRAWATTSPWPAGRSPRFLSVHLEGHYALVRNPYALMVYDITLPSQPLQVTSYAAVDLADCCSDMGTMDAVAVQGPFAYAFLDGRILRAFDVRDPSKPAALSDVPLDQYSSILEPAAIVLSPTRLLLCNAKPSLLVLGLNNPGQPVLEAAWRDYSWVRAGVIRNAEACLVGGQGILQVLDITNPNSPITLGSCDVKGEPQDVTPFGQQAFVAAGSAGLVIVDLAQPERPNRLTWPDPVGSISGGPGGGVGGGAIWSSGQLTASNTTFTLNLAMGGVGGRGGWLSPHRTNDPTWGVGEQGGQQGAGGKGGDARGGAVFQQAGSGVFFDCQFLQNQCAGQLGGSTIECVANDAGGGAGEGGAAWGAAVWQGSGHLTIVRCKARENRVHGGHGGSAERRILADRANHKGSGGCHPTFSSSHFGARPPEGGTPNRPRSSPRPLGVPASAGSLRGSNAKMRTAAQRLKIRPVPWPAVHRAP